MVLLLDSVQELRSLKEMPVYYVVQVTCSFIINAFLHQKQFQGMLDHVWSEAGHDYGQKIHCCVVRQILNELWFGFFKKQISNGFSFLPYMILPFSDLLSQDRGGDKLF